MNAIEFDTGYCLLYVDVYLMVRALVLKGARVDELGFGGCTLLTIDSLSLGSQVNKGYVCACARFRRMATH